MNLFQEVKFERLKRVSSKTSEQYVIRLLVLPIDFLNSAVANAKFVSKRTLCIIAIIYMHLTNLEPRFKFQRVSRPKEVRQTVTKRAATNGFSSFGSIFWLQRMGNHCYYFVTVLVLVICMLSSRFACWSNVQIQSVVDIAVLH